MNIKVYTNTAKCKLDDLDAGSMFVAGTSDLDKDIVFIKSDKSVDSKVLCIELTSGIVYDIQPSKRVIPVTLVTGTLEFRHMAVPDFS